MYTSLQEANKISAFSYLYEDIGHSASQISQAFESCSITHTVEINAFFLSKWHCCVVQCCWYRHV